MQQNTQLLSKWMSWIVLLVACKPNASHTRSDRKSRKHIRHAGILHGILLVNFLKMVAVLLLRQTKSNEPVGVMKNI